MKNISCLVLAALFLSAVPLAAMAQVSNAPANKELAAFFATFEAHPNRPVSVQPKTADRRPAPIVIPFAPIKTSTNHSKLAPAGTK